MYLQKQSRRNCLKVSGEGSISVSPNQANITLGAITEHENLQHAQKENTSIMTNIIDAILKMNVPKENIQTVIYRIDPQYDYVDGRQIFRGFRVNHQLQIKIDDLDFVGVIIDAAVAQGANTISNIEFSVDQPGFYYNEALKIALQNTYQKALTITSQIRANLNPVPVQIDEVSQIPTPPIPFTTLATVEATPIQPGEIKISATIVATYNYC